MAITTASPNNELVKYAKEIFAHGYVRDTRFNRYQGKSANSVIRMVRDLEANGKQINVPLIDALKGNGKGTGIMNGQEEAIDNYGKPMWADWLRHAVKWSKSTNKDVAFNFKDVATPQLNEFYKRRLKEETIKAFLSIPQESAPIGYRGEDGARINGVTWDVATATQKNNWMDANSDRVLFGAAIANYVAGNFASSAANCDTTNDRLSTAIVDMARRRAQRTVRNKIRPMQMDGEDREIYILFAGSRAIRDFKNEDKVVTAVSRAFATKAWDTEHPLFHAGDVWWNNVLVTEIEDFDDFLVLTGIGASSADVVPYFLCGASALAHVTGQMPEPTKADETDYGFNTGVGIEGQYGIGKVAKIPQGGTSLVDWGMFTGFVAASADA